MSISKYPLASTTWNEAEYEAIQRVIDSGMFTMGQNVYEFEKQFASFTGSKFCVMVNSGSSANLIMVAALRYSKHYSLQAEEEIIVPAISWSTTYSPLQQYGLKLKFVDVDSKTLNYDISALSEAVTDQTRAIMIVNLLGNPNDFNAINQIIKDRNIILIEDNCESLGAKFNGQYTGTFGVMGSYSAFFSHHICTMEGGMVVTDDEELYHIMLSLRAHGWTRDLPRRNMLTGTKSDDLFQETFKFVLPGYNIRPLEMSGAIGIEQLRKLPNMISQRRHNAEMFLDLMKNYRYLHAQEEVGESSWFGFSIIIDSNAPFTREELVQIFIQHEIEVRPIVAGNFAKNETMHWYKFEIHNKLKNADYIDLNGLFIGNHHYPMHQHLNVLKSALNQLASIND